MASVPRPRAIGAYPRWRGGNDAGEVLDGLQEGLSPLARGKHSGDEGDGLWLGPIPAGAGET